MTNITKTFGSVVANHKVSMDIRRGEILSLLGENGSGKTTLMNMLSGIYYPDAGQIFVDGREVSIRSPKDAFDLGIGMIHQHFKLVDVFTAAENVILGLPEQGRINRKAIAQKVQAICDRYGFDIDPNQKVYDMTVSQKQTLEIVKVLYRGANVLILDEPTAVLTPQETEKLFAVIRNMKADGKAIVIITHKLHEVLAVSDRVAIVRKGEYVGDVPTAEATELSLTEMMVGKKVALNIDRPEPVDPQLRLSVRDLNCFNKEGVQVLHDVNFDVYSGEILGIAGISGCGQKELLESI
ncbi:MAG: ATP-binding cassette domain-containing protein, partial [Clostridia bacterium]|nr:ATP-binding cassette domain-containing protein [Clostridia bacterium]